MKPRSRLIRHLIAAASAAAIALSFAPVAWTSASGDLDHSELERYQPRFGRTKPLVVVVGENAGTELIDFTVPYGVLSASGVADILAVATLSGSIRMLPALRIQPQETLDSFDAAHPEGADYVIVPAVRPADEGGSRVLIAWLQSQAAKGATMVSICDGALMVAKAGLFSGHFATGHWATQKQRQHDFPNAHWLTNIRYVADGKVVSSAGVSAAFPLSLALVESIGGHDRAAAVAKELGIQSWGNAHDSSTFRLGAGIYFLAARNWVSRHQDVELPVIDGVDDIALAVSADAFSRTFRGKAYASAKTLDPIRTRYGLTLLPDRVGGKSRSWRPIDLAASIVPSGQSLTAALDAIHTKYGRSTATFVALQLEYPQ
ncbi:MAG: DJ-1/PfpI family protein [Pseudomonadota bacterium]